MSGKSFEEVAERIRTIEIDEAFDLIVAIANGGIIPAALLNQRLNLDVQLLKINFRDIAHQPKYDAPKLLKAIDFDFQDKRILLVDDRIKSGGTIKMAVELLKGAKLIRTFAVNGEADYSLYNESCFKFPWIL